MPKFTDLPVSVATHTTDLLAKVNDPSGVPVSQKLTLAQLVTFLQTAMASFQTASTNTTIDAAGNISTNSAVDVGSGPNISLLADGSASLANGVVTISATGDVEITDTTKGPIIKSPDGTRYRIKVANGGALSTVAA